MALQDAIKWNEEQLVMARKVLVDAKADVKWYVENLAALRKLEDQDERRSPSSETYWSM